jgi:hypothetical protein
MGLSFGPWRWDDCRLSSYSSFSTTTMVNSHFSNIQLYTCSLEELNSGIVPKTPLPHSHPFHGLLLNHLQSLTSTGKYDSVIDAFISVYSGEAQWRSKSSPKNIVARRGAVRKLLIKQTPNFVTIEQDISEGNGFHNHTHGHGNFIYITKKYADMGNDSYLQLAPEALLKATVNHELSHWLFT